MATQIISTPVLKGNDAAVVLKEMKRKPTPESRMGAQILADRFVPMGLGKYAVAAASIVATK